MIVFVSSKNARLAQLVERLIDVEKATGSNPVSRTARYVKLLYSKAFDGFETRLRCFVSLRNKISNWGTDSVGVESCIAHLDFLEQYNKLNSGRAAWWSAWAGVRLGDEIFTRPALFSFFVFSSLLWCRTHLLADEVFYFQKLFSV